MLKDTTFKKGPDARRGRRNNRGLWYLEGGNPPHNAGLYLDGKVIIFWPAGIKPTEERCLNIYRLWENQEMRAIFSTSRVREELLAAGLIEGDA